MKHLNSGLATLLRLHQTTVAFFIGLVVASGSVYAGVSVEQTPLTLRSALPPNIMLMYDDSGSMEWSVMPDKPPGKNRAETELINSAINGVYYNPSIAYLPPYTKQAQPTALNPTYTRYPQASYSEAWLNGFKHSDGTRNIAAYNGSKDTTTSSISEKPDFSHRFKIELGAVYDYQPPEDCPSGFTGPNAEGLCTKGVPIKEEPCCQGYNTSYNSSINACNTVSSIALQACSDIPAPGAPGNANDHPDFELSGSGNNWQCRRQVEEERCAGSIFGFCYKFETVLVWKEQAPRCQGYDNFTYSGPNRGQCGSGPQFEPEPCNSTVAPGAPGYANTDGTSLFNDRCISTPDTAFPECPDDYTIDPDSNNCKSDEPTSNGDTAYRSLFVYMAPSGSGPVRHYVGVEETSSTLGSWSNSKPGTCEEVTLNKVKRVRGWKNSNIGSFSQGLPANRCHSISDDSGHVDDAGNSLTVGENIANWFSYYRKREYMAKSGLMNAFATLDPTTRFGFGSINSRNSSAIPSSIRTSTTPRLAKVTPFGSGANSSQRSAFWNWLDGIPSNGGTPLRRSLKTIGEYYKKADPWRSGSIENPSNPQEELSCRQSYTILMTDGYWNGSGPGVDNADNPNSIKRRTGPAGQCFEYPEASSGSSCLAPPSEVPYVGSHSNTLADVAMKYWLDDLRPNSENRVPTSVEDPAFWQHMSTFTVGLFGKDAGLPGVTPSGTTGADIGLWALNGSAPSNFNWPKPSGSSVNTISDLVHAGINGRGGFYSAGDPEAFQRGLQDALRRVQERVGTGASLAANSTRLDTGTTTYQSTYFSGRWQGNVRAFSVDPDTGAVSAVPDWSAADSLPAWDSRSIKTCNPCGVSADNTVVDFQFGNLSTAQKSALNDSSGLVDYLRGQEGNLAYRTRNTALGDIINSQPVFVGKPNPNLYVSREFTGSADYPGFAATNTSRVSLLWVAANDGMLHAFDTNTGAEVFAYLPNAVILPHSFDLNNDGTDNNVNGIKDLASPNYGSGAVAHQSFNDGELTVADAYDGTNWKTVLVGTTGRGVARAIYAVDITDPSAPVPLWERAAEDGKSDSGWIGQIIGKPVIAQTSDGSWSALMGNGYNSAGGKAALLQFDLFTGALNVHETSAAGSNGLAQPAVHIGDGESNVSTVAWAGDLNGVVWEFDLSCSLGCTGAVRFNEPGGRPITAGMLSGINPDNQDVWVFFGTGKYVASSDLADNSKQRWYGLIVEGDNSVDGLSADADLVERSILEEQAASSDEVGARVLEEDSGEISGKSGWYMPLVSPGGTGQGERMITPNQFQGSLLLGVTRIPGSNDPCNPSGRGWIMAVDPFTGGSPEETFFDRTGDSQFNDDDKLNDQVVGGIGFGVIPNNPIFVGDIMLVSFDDASTSSIATSRAAAGTIRTSWRELVEE